MKPFPVPLTYQQTLDLLFAQLPMYQRIGAAAYRADLGNIVAMCEALGNPQKHLRAVHVGGTNGKGSVSHLTAAALQLAGYKTGLYTSPHLVDFRERIRVNGHMIGEDDVVTLTQRLIPLVEQIKPSFFELTVAMAFLHFSAQQVDVAVIEVGMGGRLDSTNIINPDLAAITNIGHDHMQFLGDTLAKVAGEKAGIIKPGVPVVIGERHPETEQVFEQTAADLQSPIIFAQDQFEVDEFNSTLTGARVLLRNKATGEAIQLTSALTGHYQKKNLVTFMAVIDRLRQQGYFITNQAIEQAAQEVCRLTGLMGRWQVLGQQPLVIADCAHNPEGLTEAMQQLHATPHSQLHLVVGVVNDKDLSQMLTLLPKHATFYFAKPNIPRGLDAPVLAKNAAEAGLRGMAYQSVKEAVTAAHAAACPTDHIYIGGSMFVVAEALPLFN